MFRALTLLGGEVLTEDDAAEAVAGVGVEHPYLHLVSGLCDRDLMATVVDLDQEPPFGRCPRFHGDGGYWCAAAATAELGSYRDRD